MSWDIGEEQNSRDNYGVLRHRYGTEYMRQLPCLKTYVWSRMHETITVYWDIDIEDDARGGTQV